MYRFLFFLSLMFILAGCSGPNKKSNSNVISVSILPQKFFIEKIAGDYFDINVLIPPGASPATYEPTTKQMTELSKSSYYFRIGHIEFEKSWMNKFKSSNPEMEIVDLSENLELIFGKETRHGDHVHQSGIDPHVWVSTWNVGVMAKSILNLLIEISPEKKDVFTNNYESFISEISETDSFIKKQLSNCNSDHFLIFHPALTYFAKDYNLTQVTIENEGKNPSPEHLQKIVNMAFDKNIKAIFIQKQFNADIAKSIADEIGGKVIQIDPLDENWTEQMRFIGQILGEVLK